ncbi:type II secretion system protein [Candidatus Saccharibacteria bacterium]|nr:type II secretion system protein [Candidatus Saccharibacteria bacterium]
MNIKSEKGFTIIEVVLVLAIAGLIFLMVFIALPAMQRSQRDTQRRQDYSALSSAITSYITNNNGNLPKSGASLAGSRYINATGKDPNGLDYQIHVVEAPSGNADPAYKDLTVIPNNQTPSTVYVVRKAECSTNDNGDPYPKYVNSTRAFAIFGNLEAGNGTYCSASQ